MPHKSRKAIFPLATLAGAGSGTGEAGKGTSGSPMFLKGYQAQPYSRFVAYKSGNPKKWLARPRPACAPSR